MCSCDVRTGSRTPSAINVSVSDRVTQRVVLEEEMRAQAVFAVRILNRITGNGAAAAIGRAAHKKQHLQQTESKNTDAPA